ncbi:MAG: hypothetical protein M3Z06_16290 [Actinomycetota bacterium]|nr:hypothetical protein [Actinomycetota bacterium]
MTYVKQILTELREKRLWPVAAVLILALIAVPTLLAKSSGQAPAAPPPQSAPAAADTAVPAVSVESTATNSKLKGRARDPFLQQKLAAAAKPASTATTKSSGGSTGTSGGSTTSAGSKSTTSSTTTTGSGTGSTPPAVFPTIKPKPAPTGLTATETYRVTIATTNSSGGLDTTDSVERLSVLPSQRQPLLVELGVLQGGRRVLFAVQPGTIVRGPGTCVPGSIDCELISLAPGQIEGLSSESRSGVVGVAQYAVTAIGVDKHPSVATADRARRTESAAGRRLLDNSTLTSLSLFRYSPSLGAIVDLRNLTVGGN